MTKSLKVFFFIFVLTFLATTLFFVKPVSAQVLLDCDTISGTVKDGSGNPIFNASVHMTLNGTSGATVLTQENGLFVDPYGTNGKELVFIEVSKSGYPPFSGYLGGCTADIVLSLPTTPTPLPSGSTLRCGGTCSIPDQCEGADDGCTYCHGGFCVNPGNVPTPAPSGNANAKLCNNDAKCMSCFLDGNVWTAIGCIPSNNLNSFVSWFLGKLIFIASGVAFLLMAFGALQIITSAGSPEKVQAGQQLITSALAGLIFVILSLFLLKLIGVDILQIPGFAK